MPWTGPHPGQLARFNTLTADQRHDYQAFYDFLCDEVAVTAALDALAKALDTGSFEGFKQSIAKMETDRNFNFEVASPLGPASPDIFLGYIAAGKPIDDIAFAGKQHGRSTHRVQWMMIALWAETNNTLTLPLVDLYKALGGPAGHSWGAGKPLFGAVEPPVSTPYMWNDIVDSENDDVDNATRPEYFNYTMIRTLQPKLYDAMG